MALRLVCAYANYSRIVCSLYFYLWYVFFQAAKEYLRRGANVTIVARTQSKLDIAVKELKGLVPSTSPQKIISISVDTGSSQEKVTKAFEPAVAEMGTVDVLVNCAGKVDLTLSPHVRDLLPAAVHKGDMRSSGICRILCSVAILVHPHRHRCKDEDNGVSQLKQTLFLNHNYNSNPNTYYLLSTTGTSIAGEFDALDSTEFERMLRVNVLGSVYPTRAVVGGMKAHSQGRGGGRIIFVSSQVAQVALHGYTAYAGKLNSL